MVLHFSLEPQFVTVVLHFQFVTVVLYFSLEPPLVTVVLQVSEIIFNPSMF